MNFKLFIFIFILFICQSCGVKAKPDSFRNKAIPSYIQYYTDDSEYELANPQIKK